ncbi:4-hydroxyphenylacetate 3-hydroxylase family protein [Rhodoligotrophos defluvii]|uniref:4-hydroxyphenylacetate 3-hydroxylase family protein n=1 Tax=Rhodoligotrophos defluvii TaxID=2561934 RepID=UPI001485BCD8|nr:4-hydroxyphenylacetate 3-hydroxylase N-terminal domain-containing protein [Rhodoligotrophos defluvii]
MTATAALNGRNPSQGTAPLRTGADFLAGLRSAPRSVYVNGEKVTDPASHPAFRGGARAMARLFDYAAAPENREVMTYPSPTDGKPVWRCYQIPHNHADLRAKRIAAEKWAECSFGLMGRTPDHVANFLAGFAAVPSVFAAGGEQFAENVVRFYEHARDTHAYLAYAIVPPQIDRSKPAHQQSDPTLYAGVVRETDAGIYLSGAQQLATGGVFADYIHLSCIHPMKPGDENYALSLVVPTTAEGVKLISRRAFPLQANSSFDYPLTSRFDETDCLLVLDNVFVPWEHVFAFRNLEVCWNQWWKTPSHLYGNHQAQARYVTKLRFLMGLAKRMNEATGNDAQPPVMVEMGEIAALASIYEGMLQAQEVMATVDENGVLWPSKTALYSAMALQSKINPWMIDTVRELTGAAMITLPSAEADFENPDIARDIERYFCSAKTDARSRVALMRLAWDFIGSEFGNRHQQYEKFYGGASFLIKMNVYRAYDFERASRMVDDALNLPPLDD